MRAGEMVRVYVNVENRTGEMRGEVWRYRADRPGFYVQQGLKATISVDVDIVKLLKGCNRYLNYMSNLGFEPAQPGQNSDAAPTELPGSHVTNT